MELVIIVGHDKKDKGASNSVLNINEFDFNNKFANDVSSGLSIDHTIVYRKLYSELPFEVNTLNSKYIISLHCNAFNTKASGTETLYYYKSVKGKEMAEVFQNNIVQALGLPDRGVKGKSTEDRGGYLLRYTNAPCIITEPFFIDNNNDFEVVKSKYNILVAAYIKSIYDVRTLLV